MFETLHIDHFIEDCDIQIDESSIINNIIIDPDDTTIIVSHDGSGIELLNPVQIKQFYRYLQSVDPGMYVSLREQMDILILQ